MALLEVEVPVPAAVSLLVAVEPDADPEAEPESEPEAFTLVLPLAGAVAVELEAAWSVLVAWLLDVLEAASLDVSLWVVLLLFTSPEQPAPSVSARASRADVPNKLRFFFMLNASIVVEKTAHRSFGGVANLDPRRQAPVPSAGPRTPRRIISDAMPGQGRRLRSELTRVLRCSVRAGE